MHFCADELMAILLAIPCVPYLIAKFRERFHK